METPMSIKLTLKKVLYVSLYYSGLERLLTRLLRVDAAVILMFHGVAEQVSMPPEVNFHIPSKTLDRLLQMLTRRYGVIGMGELLDRLARGQRLNKQIVLTFDDGYRNNLIAAAPLMRRHGVPFSVYLATGPIGSPRFLPLNELYTLYASGKLNHAETMAIRSRIRSRTAAEAAQVIAEIPCQATSEERAAVAESFAMLSWDEVRELSNQPGVEIGGHTVSHCNMAAEPPEDRDRELELCRRAIAENLGKPPRLFAYPFGGPGYHNDATRQSVIRVGFECAITTEPGMVRQGCDPFKLPRTCAHPSAWFQAGELLYMFVRARYTETR
jgi:peptidoglycan/xylan/chitin deacetylase (PgdA/CDA1 family)